MHKQDQDKWRYPPGDPLDMTTADAENALQPVTTATDAFFLNRYCRIVGP